MGLIELIDNLYKPIEIAPDGFLLATGAIITGLLNDAHPASFMLTGLSIAQYQKGIFAYNKTSEHIETYGNLDGRFVSIMRETLCYKFGIRCAARRNGRLEEYQELSNK
ncbi:hypothetical protein HOD61_00445 [archaeon]|jgi:hypothetical protein|nr:hypothetical protein [archaeon]